MKGYIEEDKEYTKVRCGACIGNRTHTNEEVRCGWCGGKGFLVSKRKYSAKEKKAIIMVLKFYKFTGDLFALIMNSDTDVEKLCPRIKGLYFVNAPTKEDTLTHITRGMDFTLDGKKIHIWMEVPATFTLNVEGKGEIIHLYFQTDRINDHYDSKYEDIFIGNISDFKPYFTLLLDLYNAIALEGM